MPQFRTAKLIDVLKEASDGKLEDAWIYLKEETELLSENECLVLRDIEEPHEYATSLGFPLEGLDTSSIEDCAAWAHAQPGGSSDGLLLYAFRYYWKFDAFPKYAWAPDPPPVEQVRLSMALEFYRRLGPERPDVLCSREECERGAILHSVLCRIHHYEAVRKEPCPFDGDA